LSFFRILRASSARDPGSTASHCARFGACSLARGGRSARLRTCRPLALLTRLVRHIDWIPSALQELQEPGVNIRVAFVCSVEGCSPRRSPRLVSPRLKFPPVRRRRGSTAPSCSIQARGPMLPCAAALRDWNEWDGTDGMGGQAGGRRLQFAAPHHSIGRLRWLLITGSCSHLSAFGAAQRRSCNVIPQSSEQCYHRVHPSITQTSETVSKRRSGS
jgi:hypothetical protein